MSSMREISIPRQILGLFGWLAVSFAAAGIGGLASASAGSFYLDLTRPDWAPPGGLFAPVWSLLYLLMGFAAWLVWRERGFGRARTPLLLFLLQLVANALWTWIFFVWHLGALAFGEIVLLWALILWTLIGFWGIRPLAGILLLPYLAWVTFASALSYSIWQMNPHILG